MPRNFSGISILMHSSRFRTMAPLALLVILSLGFIYRSTRLDVGMQEDIYFIWRDGGLIANGENPYERVLSGDMRENDKYSTYFPLFYLFVAATQFLGLKDFHAWIRLWQPTLLAFHLGIALLLGYSCQRSRQPILGMVGVLFWTFNRWTLNVVRIAHIDFVPIFCLIASLLAFEKHRRASFFLFGISVAVKQIAIFVAPLYLIWTWQSSRRVEIKARLTEMAHAVVCFAVVPFAISLPFLVWNPEAFIKSILLSATRNPGGHFSDSSFGTFLGLYGIPARLPMLLLMTLVIVAAAREQIGRYMSVLIIFSVFVDFSPVLFSQYMAWVVPFLILAACDQHEAITGPVAAPETQTLSKGALTPLSWIAMVAGVLLVLLAILAYPLGLAHSSGFGWRRSLGVIIGLLSILFGYRGSRKSTEPR